MRNILNFLIEVGKLKRKKRKGWELRGIESPETIADHTFRMTIMTWLLSGQKRLHITKILKMALIHDLCETYAGDTTPYDSLLSKDKKQWKEITKKWPRFLKKEKERLSREKYKKSAWH